MALALAGCSREGEPQRALPARVVLVTGLRGDLEPCGCSGDLVGGLDAVSAAVASARSGGGGALLLVGGDILGTAAGAVVPSGQESAKAALFDGMLTAWRPALILGRAPVGAGERLDKLARASGATLVWAGQRGAGTSLPRRGGAPSAVVLPEGAPALDACLDARRVGVDLVIALTAGTAAPSVGPGCQPDLWLHADRGDAPRQIDGVLHVGLDSPEQRVVTAQLIRPVRPTGQNPWVLVPRDGASWEAPLGPSAQRDAAARAQMDALFASFAGSGAREPAARASEGPHFVGSRTCAACHAEAYVWWRGTPHGRALRTLEKRGRQHDLACVGCHVTGFGEPSGAAQPPFGELAGVGCESCHGAGSAHVDDPTLAPGVAEGPVLERTCTRCHDAAHSVGFAFAPARAALDARPHRVPR